MLFIIEKFYSRQVTNMIVATLDTLSPLKIHTLRKQTNTFPFALDSITLVFQDCRPILRTRYPPQGFLSGCKKVLSVCEYIWLPSGAHIHTCDPMCGSSARVSLEIRPITKFFVFPNCRPSPLSRTPIPDSESVEIFVRNVLHLSCNTRAFDEHICRRYLSWTLCFFSTTRKWIEKCNTNKINQYRKF